MEGRLQCLSEEFSRLTSKCPPQVCSSWSWHRIPAAAARRLRQTVRVPHHKVDPCPPPLCTAGQLTISSSELGEKGSSHQSKKCALLSYVSLRARQLVWKCERSSLGSPQSEVTHMGKEGWWGAAALHATRCASVRPSVCPSGASVLTWRNEAETPLSEPLLLIPVDLHSCLQRRLATPTAASGMSKHRNLINNHHLFIYLSIKQEEEEVPQTKYIVFSCKTNVIYLWVDQ